jgi:transposase-like protein
MSETRRKFDREFREGAVRIVRETGKPIAQVARDLGINAGTLGNWVVKDRAEHEGTQGLSTEDVSVSWLYKWLDREPTDRQRRRAALDERVRELFERSQRTYGSPRIHADLLAEGWQVGVNTVADSMRRQVCKGANRSAPRD